MKPNYEQAWLELWDFVQLERAYMRTLISPKTGMSLYNSGMTTELEVIRNKMLALTGKRDPDEDRKRV